VGRPQFRLWTSDELSPVRVLDNYSHFGPKKSLSKGLFELMDEASEEIMIQNPYLVLTPECAEHLERAARERHVKVRFAVTSPTSTDSLLTQSVLTFEWKKIARQIPGIEINGAVGPEDLHAKIFVFDRKKVAVGSYNMDAMSQNRNAELALVADSPSLAGEIGAEIDRFIHEQSVQYDPDAELGPEQIPGSAEHIEKLKVYYGLASWFRPIL
jgi:phosphatidylserine/phosphatidylglycerophosphate/cardiolipin synthase-like enzyme